MARYRIAVCDDEPSELEDIVQSVKRYDVHVEALRKNEQEKLRAEFNEQQYRLQMEYYQQLKERQEETRALWHDIKKIYSGNAGSCGTREFRRTSQNCTRCNGCL